MTSQTSKVHSFIPCTDESEFNCSKLFLCMDIDGSNPTAWNLSTLVPVDQTIHPEVFIGCELLPVIIRSGEFLAKTMETQYYSIYSIYIMYNNIHNKSKCTDIT